VPETGCRGDVAKRLPVAGGSVEATRGAVGERPGASGPVVVALQGDGAIARWRELMGPTDSKKAPKGTIRGDWGTDVERNAVHGSDAPETARVEIAYWFNATEIHAPVEALP
jgi:hypothetical protein